MTSFGIVEKVGEDTGAKNLNTNIKEHKEDLDEVQNRIERKNSKINNYQRQLNLMDKLDTELEKLRMYTTGEDTRNFHGQKDENKLNEKKAAETKANEGFYRDLDGNPRKTAFKIKIGLEQWSNISMKNQGKHKEKYFDETLFMRGPPENLTPEQVEKKKVKAIDHAKSEIDNERKDYLKRIGKRVKQTQGRVHDIKTDDEIKAEQNAEEREKVVNSLQEEYLDYIYAHYMYLRYLERFRWGNAWIGRGKKKHDSLENRKQRDNSNQGQ